MCIICIVFFWLDDLSCLTPRPFEVWILQFFWPLVGLSSCTTIFPHHLSFVLASSRSIFPSSRSIFPSSRSIFPSSLFFKSYWMLRHLYLSSASLKFDSCLNSTFLLVSFITLRGLGFCSVSPVSPSVCFLPSLITLVITQPSNKLHIYPHPVFL